MGEATESPTTVAAGSDETTVAAGSDKKHDLELRDLKWKIWLTRVDILQKLIISLIGAAIAGIFYVFQANETESRYFSDLQSQRERADADLRANMFKALFEAYFKNKIEIAQKASLSGIDSPKHAKELLLTLGQEVMLGDLLTRNFETVDVRPLFEDLERRLTALVERRGDKAGQEELQALAFLEREKLRRTAYGATARQIEMLKANADASSERVWVEQCGDGKTIERLEPERLPGLGSSVAIVNGIGEATVDITVTLPDGGTFIDRAPAATSEPIKGQPRTVPLSVTYFDMPVLEHLRLKGGGRLALTLADFASTASCRRFRDQMGSSTREICDVLKDERHGIYKDCRRARLAITLIPSGYIGIRDQPYQSELSKKRPSLFERIFGRETAASAATN